MRRKESVYKQSKNQRKVNTYRHRQNPAYTHIHTYKLMAMRKVERSQLNKPIRKKVALTAMVFGFADN